VIYMEEYPNSEGISILQRSKIKVRCVNKW
jgi:hypothetical protein